MMIADINNANDKIDNQRHLQSKIVESNDWSQNDSKVSNDHSIVDNCSQNCERSENIDMISCPNDRIISMSNNKNEKLDKKDKMSKLCNKKDKTCQEKVIIKRGKIRWSPKLKLSPTSKDTIVRPKKSATPVKKLAAPVRSLKWMDKSDVKDKTEDKMTDTDKNIKPSKVKLIIEAFENNMKVRDTEAVNNDNIEVKNKCKDAFKLMMESSKKFGGGQTPSPGRKVQKRRNLSLRTSTGKKK